MSYHHKGLIPCSSLLFFYSLALWLLSTLFSPRTRTFLLHRWLYIKKVKVYLFPCVIVLCFTKVNVRLFHKFIEYLIWYSLCYPSFVAAFLFFCSLPSVFAIFLTHSHIWLIILFPRKLSSFSCKVGLGFLFLLLFIIFSCFFIFLLQKL